MSLIDKLNAFLGLKIAYTCDAGPHIVLLFHPKSITMIKRIMRGFLNSEYGSKMK